MKCMVCTASANIRCSGVTRLNLFCLNTHIYGSRLRLRSNTWISAHLTATQRFSFSRIKSGIFGQTAKFGQPPCLFYSSIIGIKKIIN